MRNLGKVLAYLTLLWSYSAFSQSTRISVQLFKEGKRQVSQKPLKVLLVGGHTTVLASDSDSFVLPDSIKSHKYTIVLTQNRYKLEFKDIYVPWNDLLPLWIIDIDYAPINKDNEWVVSKEKLPKVRWLYTLNPGNGSLLVWHGFKKPFK